MDLHDLRREYARSGLSEEDLAASPFSQFESWFNIINQPGTIDATAMILATAGADGIPTQRTVLLKSFDETGFTFFTNYESQKGQAIAQNPHVSLIFAWYQLERQIIINGVAEKVSEQESNDYFQSRPRGSQIAASLSRQSTPVPNREHMQTTFDELEIAWKDQAIEKPPFWGGYKVVPSRFEFWQGRESRLHDRLVYAKTASSGWDISRLAP